jgi:uncharacterized protein (TIGR02268 family)
MFGTGALTLQPEDGTRRLDVAGKAAATAHELRVAPGVVTSLVFDTPLDPEAMKAELDALALRFGLADVGMSRTTLMLRPSALFTSGTRQRLEVRFAGGEEPRRAVLELVSATREEAERQVEVTRQRPWTEERVAALEARCAACEAELEARKARGAMPLAMLVLQGELRPELRQGGQILLSHPGRRRPEDVELMAVHLYRTRSRAAASLRLHLAPGARRWGLAEAVVRDTRTGQRLEVHGVVMEPPTLEPGSGALLVVEWAAGSEPGGTVDVRILERDGARHVEASGVGAGAP